jgi:class 3 adenylate cyclase/alpha-beta hydrolase superfamily lysophospholipase
MTRYAMTVDGVHIAYQIFGDGPLDIVYTPGFVSNVDTCWDLGHHQELFAALTRLGRVIIFDRRGTGLSDRPDRAGSLALELGINDLNAVMEAAASERVVLFAFEEGGSLTSMFAAANPGRVIAMVLFAPWVKGGVTDDYPAAWNEEDVVDWDRHVAEEWGTEAFTRYNLATSGPALAKDPRFVEDLTRYFASCASPGAMQAIDAMQMGIDARPILPAVSAPTLVLHRADDRMGSPEESRYVASLIPGALLVELPGEEHHPSMGDVGSIVREVEAFLGTLEHEEAEFDRSLATVLFTDIVGSTERAAELGDRAWAALLERHHAIVRAMLTRYRGQEISTAGDGFFATFDGPARAVRCAQQIARALEPTGLEVRAGVHTGEVRTIDGNVGGLGVVIGARVGALAGASEVLVSQTVKDLVAGSGLMFEEAGEHHLKGVPERWRLYRALDDHHGA